MVISTAETMAKGVFVNIYRLRIPEDVEKKFKTFPQTVFTLGRLAVLSAREKCGGYKLDAFRPDIQDASVLSCRATEQYRLFFRKRRLVDIEVATSPTAYSYIVRHGDREVVVTNHAINRFINRLNLLGCSEENHVRYFLFLFRQAKTLPLSEKARRKFRRYLDEEGTLLEGCITKCWRFVVIVEKKRSTIISVEIRRDALPRRVFEKRVEPLSIAA